MRKINGEAKGKIIDLKAKNESWSASKVRAELQRLKKLQEYRGMIPSLRAVQYVISRNEDEIVARRTDPLEQPWTAGEYGIPEHIIPKLLEYQRLIWDFPLRRLTIRKASVMCRLYSAIVDLLKRKNITDPKLHYGHWSRIADAYVEAEQTKDKLKQRLLDYNLFIRDDLSIDDALLASVVGSMAPEEIESLINKAKEVNRKPIEDVLKEHPRIKAEYERLQKESKKDGETK